MRASQSDLVSNKAPVSTMNCSVILVISKLDMVPLSRLAVVTQFDSILGKPI